MKHRLIRLFFSTLSLALLSLTPLAQSTPSPSPSTTQVIAADKNGKEAVCEGALEIIPSRQVSFARKRYIAAHAKPKSKLAKPRSSSRK
jgi:hypothetical protein